jgi:hypothetical protein
LRLDRCHEEKPHEQENNEATRSSESNHEVIK